MNPREVATVPDGGETQDTELPSRLGHFEIVGRLGSGGMGLVFEGRDTVLDRRVALKLLHPGRVGNPIAPARLLREAQALAKLSHRNVVTVYEVGMAGDDPFVAMELVEGETLAEWMKKPREWRAVLDVFIAAGHGLAAVHALGLVHRDFKPSNVLFDKDGTPKLGDFGLVRPLGAASESVAATDPTSKLTETGSVMGTPAYMAPEQRLGLTVDPRADQYSFAKSLGEALGESVPAAVQPILDRALSDDPDDRYPDMATLLDDLSRVRRGKRARWIATGGAVAVIGAVAMAWGFGRAQSGGDPCRPPTQRLAKVWSDARRNALAAHLQTIDPVLGAQRFAAATRVFDRGASRWMDQHVDACQVAHAGQQSGALLDRRMGCLDRALLEIDDSVRVLERATDRTTLDNAMKATGALPALDDCADVNALMELLPRPTNPVQRKEADALSRLSVAIDIARRTRGTKTNVVREAEAAVARAKALGDPETLARALRSLAFIQEDNESGEVIIATLKEAINAAAAAHDDRMVAELWPEVLTTLVSLKKPAEAQMLLPAAEAAVARTKSTTELHVTFLYSKAQVAAANSDLDSARAALDVAQKELDAAGANAPGSELRKQLITVKTRAALLHAATGDFKSMTEGLRDVIKLANAQYGPDHPDVMQLQFNLGVGLRRLGDDEGALVAFREAARIGEARLSPSPGLSDYLYGVGSTLVSMQRTDEAIVYLERAAKMARSTLPPGDPRVSDSIGALAAAYMDKQRFDEAHTLLDETISILEKADGFEEKLAVAYTNRGDWAVQTNHCEQGWGDFDRAEALYRKLDDMEDVYATMFSRSQCQLSLAMYTPVLHTTEQILSAKQVPAEQRALASFDHGRATNGLQHRDAGIGEVRAARAEMVRLKMSTAMVDNWLAKWTKPGAVPPPENKNAAGLPAAPAQTK